MRRIIHELEGVSATSVKVVCGLICFAILVSHTVAMLRWSEVRGVYDDVCYLRQAHLFQRFGLDGLNTDARMDDDGYFVGKLKEIAFPEPENQTRWPCHVRKPSGKIILQYPPGTGFLLAVFPQGHQVAPLYISASVIVCSLALLSIFLARTLPSTIGAGLFGALAVYGMITPAKASYSVAPTLALCSIVGFFTALWQTRGNQSRWVISLIGLLIGVSVNFRLPNILLAAGYCVFLATAFLRSRSLVTFLNGLSFGAGVVIGMSPTLIAQAINAGSLFATTYGASDALGPAFNIHVLGEYMRDTQSLLIALAVGWTFLLLRVSTTATRQIVLIVASNLLINLGFFLSHPVFTPYYIVPIAMLSTWTLSFSSLIQSHEEAAPASRQREALV